MNPGPAEALNCIHEFVLIDSPPRHARDILIEIALTKAWFTNKTDAQDAADRWHKVFLQRIVAHLNDFGEAGRITTFTINSSSPYHIQGASFIEPHDSSAVRREKANRILLKNCESFLKTISFENFEALCAGMLLELGAQRPTITASTRDEGIDFYGRLKLDQILAHGRTLPIFERQLTLWMVGQAKHFQNLDVSTPDIRELVGSVHLARSRAYSTDADTRYMDLTIRPCDSIFYMFFTTGQISRDGWRLLKTSGVVGMDGPMVAAFLVDRSIGIHQNAFSAPALNKWLATSLSKCTRLGDTK
jgi:hypothetical protein